VSEPTVARITATGSSAIASLRVAGEGATGVLSHCLPDFTEPQVGQVRLLSVPLTGISSAEQVVLTQRSTENYDLHCHGGEKVVELLIATLVAAGAVEKSWQEQFPSTSQLTQLQQEATLALTEATTERVAAILLDQYNGALETALEKLQMTQEEELRQTLLARGKLGVAMLNGWDVVFTGQPNVGKSSLLNQLAGFDRAIVHPQHGTTRDLVRYSTALAGWPVRLTDTAGIRQTNDAIEQEGVTRARQAAKEAALVILVTDATTSLSPEEQSWLADFPQTLLVRNKSDLATVKENEGEAIYTSALTGAGIEQLATQIATTLVPNPPQPGEAVPFCQRHLELLRTFPG